MPWYFFKKKYLSNEIHLHKMSATTMLHVVLVYRFSLPVELRVLISKYLYRTVTNDNIHNEVRRYLLERPECMEFGPIEYWDTSNVTDMRCLFMMFPLYSEYDISRWDVSNVTDMRKMFSGCGWEINWNINSWDVSSVENMYEMFSYASHFNAPLSNWNVSKVTNMAYMFSLCVHFNQPIEDWDVSKVEFAVGMLNYAKSFNQSLEKWKIFPVMNKSDIF